jgi:glycosyltransferase involved in cell wall biosynthesis
MKIRIYIGTRGKAYGGAENTVAVLAAALREHYPVEIGSSLEGFRIESLAHSSGVELRDIPVRYLPLAEPPAPCANPCEALREERAWNAHVSEECDLFLNFGNISPPFSRAPRAGIRIFFPFGITPYTKRPQGRGPGRIWREVRHVFRRQQWQQRMRTYHLKIANSRFTQKWTRRYWGVESEVIYPPVDLDFAPAAKSNLILSVGRFAVSENQKKQHELMQTFARMTSAQKAGWEYVTAGGLVANPDDQAYFARVAAAGEQAGGRALANVDRATLKRFIEEAKIFWHGAGYGEDEDANPGGAEHFGQSTVEAMAAGCVPVVINRGGQPEIVEHGVSGFVWDTLDELEHYTRLLVDDPALLRQMSEAARARSGRFSRAAFADRFLQVISPGSN